MSTLAGVGPATEAVAVDSRPTRLLWLMKGLGRGGAERLVVDSAALIDRRRFEVHVAYLLPWKDLLVDEIRPHVAAVTCLATSGRDPRWPLRLARYVRDHDIDIVHSHSPLPGTAARLVARRGGRTRFVHTEHNLWGRYHPATRLLNAATMRTNRALIAVSQGVAQSVHPRSLRRTVAPEVVIHGTDPARIATGSAARAEARRRLDLADDAFVVGNVGNFTAKKDHASLLDAFGRFAADHPDAHLVLVGSGPLEDELRTRADGPDLAGRVTFTGSRGDVHELLAGLDVFAMSSRYEGLPIALLEAMSAGVAPVVTPVGGIPEVIDHDVHGLLVPPGCPAELADALAALAADPDRRAELGARARQAAASCDLRTAVRRQEEIYDAVRVPVGTP